MSSKITQTVELIDDLDGSTAVETVQFALSGTTYELDLSRKNKAAMDKALKPYVDAARKVKRTRASAPKATSGRRKDLSQVREWAKSAGYTVSERGRIPAEVLAAFDAK